MEIWIRQEGVENGPYTPEQVWGFLETGEVAMDDEAWTEGLDDYATVADIPGFQEQEGEPPGTEPGDLEITIRRDGVEYGPYTPQQVWEFVENGDMALDDEAWFEGCGNYVYVGDIPGFSQEPLQEHNEAAPGIMEITIRRDGKEYGPYSPGQIWDFVQTGGMAMDDEAWFEGCEDYVTVADIPGFSQPQKTPPRGNRSVKVILILLVMAGLAVGGYFSARKYKPELLTADFWTSLLPGAKGQPGDDPGGSHKAEKPFVSLPVEFKDANLETALREELKKPEGPIMTGDLLAFKELHLYNRQISDISPLAGLKNVEDLHLYNNQISDLSPLAKLKNLKWLNLEENQVSDLSPLMGLENLTRLYLYDNQVADLSPLARLKKLEDLSLNKNRFTDLTPIAGLDNLQKLFLNENGITDLAPIAGLGNLLELYLDDNKVADLKPLAKLENLEELFLHRNKLNDVSPLAGLKGLKNLRLGGNPIPDDQKKMIREALPKCFIHI